MSMAIYEPWGFSVDKAKTLIGMVLKSVEEFYDLKKRFSEANPSEKDPSSLYKKWEDDLENTGRNAIEVEGETYQVLKRLAIDEYWYGPSKIADMRFRDFFTGDPLKGIRERVPFGFILRSMSSPNEIYVVIRGTQTKPEWYNNLRSSPGEEGFIDEKTLGSVHSGFYHIYNKPNIGDRLDKGDNLPSMMDSIMGVIEEEIKNSAADSPGIKVYVTGHSLGAALATLTATQICYQKPTIKPVLYTFASPRVGDKRFEDYVSEHLKHVFRVINSEDIISAVPLASPRLLPEDEIEDMVEGLGKLGESIMKFTSLLPNLDFYHVGRTIPFTVHKGSILENHIAATYQEAIQ